MVILKCELSSMLTMNFVARPPYAAALSNRSQAVPSSNNAAGATFDFEASVTTLDSIT